MTSAKFFKFNYMIALYMIDWLIDWLLNVQRAVFQPYSGRKQVYKQKIRKRALGWVNMGNDFWLLCWVGSENLAEAGAQWPPLNELCRGIFNVQRAWHSLNTGPRFSFSSKGQVGQIFIPRDSNGWPWQSPSTISAGMVPILTLTHALGEGTLYMYTFSDKFSKNEA